MDQKIPITTKGDTMENETKIWEDRIAKIDAKLVQNSNERKRIIKEATVENRAARKKLLQDKGKLQRALNTALSFVEGEIEA